MIINVTSEDVQRYIRIWIYGLVGFLSGKGIDTVFGVHIDNHFIDTVLPIALFFGNVVWTFYGNRINAKLSEIAKYAKDPGTPVVGIVTTPTAEGRALATSIEGPVAPAGSLEAKGMANTPL